MSDSITVRVKPETPRALDSMAATMERDRDELIAEGSITISSCGNGS